MKDEIAHGKVSSTWVVLVKSQHKWLQLGEVEGWGGPFGGALHPFLWSGFLQSLPLPLRSLEIKEALLGNSEVLPRC